MKDSKHFVDGMKDVRLCSDEVMVSLDVKSLFTNVPVQEAVEVVYKKLKEDETLIERTSLSAERVRDLLQMCLSSTYFSYEGVFYEQLDGAAMGSPVSAVVANLFMEFFENLALSTSPVKPSMWKRYVDDILCFLKKGGEKDFLDHINGIRPSIELTMETESGGKISFLDCELQRKLDGSLDVTVYRKPTHTGRYLHYTSHHPVHVRRGVVRSLYDRARRIVSEEGNLKEEFTHLNNVFHENGYPEKFILSSSTPLERHEEPGEDEDEVDSGSEVQKMLFRT